MSGPGAGTRKARGRAVATLFALLLVASLGLTGCAAGEGGLGDGGEPRGGDGGPRTTATAETFESEIASVRRLTERYWAERFAERGLEYEPVNDFIGYRGRGEPFCGDQPAVPNNAFYCPAGHFIAYDEQWLGQFYEQLGDAVVYFVVPHEFGHSVQAQFGTRFRFSIEQELQADCYAGAFVGDSVRDGVITLEPGDEDELVTNFAAAGDPTDAWWRPGAHGTAAQRQDAFVTGYESGPNAC